MNQLKIVLIPLLIWVSSFQLFAQSQLSGILLNTASNDPIEGSHIINLSKKTLAISDDKGKFRIEAQAFDTLLISNINFENKQFLISELTSLIIYLTPLIIQLEEVEVSNIPKTSNIFSKRVKEIEDQKSKRFRLYGVREAEPMADIPPLFQEDNSLRFWENGSFLPPSSIDIYLIPKLFSRKYKSKMKYYSLKASKEERIKNDKKFNRDLVGELVGLNGFLLTDFISFMNADEAFITNATEYEIVVFIKEKYDEFMRFGE